MFSTLFTSAGISAVFSAILRLMSQKQKDQQQKDLAMLNESKLAELNRQNARKVKDGPTKKILAIIFCSVYFIMKIAPILMVFFGVEMDINFSWNEWQNGFLFFSDGKEALKTLTVRGIHFTPLDAELLGMILGYYFGGSLAKRR
jgi:hypothetical protein